MLCFVFISNSSLGDEQNVSILTKADRCSLFLVQGERGSESRCLVSKLFDVCSQSTLKEMEKKEEIRIPWGSGIVGYVAQSGEPVNIPDAYKVCFFEIHFFFFSIYCIYCVCLLC